MRRWSTRDYVRGFERAGFRAVEQKMIAGPVPKENPHGNAPTLLTCGTKP
jgi:hypothetical protein